MLVHGEITPSLAATLVERLQRVGQDFAQAHLAEQRLPDEQRNAVHACWSACGPGCSRRSAT